MKETLKIEGMSCGGCVNGVQRALAQLKLTKATVEVGRADVEYDEGDTTHQQIIRVINDAGYQVVEQKETAVV